MSDESKWCKWYDLPGVDHWRRLHTNFRFCCTWKLRWWKFQIHVRYRVAVNPDGNYGAFDMATFPKSFVQRLHLATTLLKENYRRSQSTEHRVRWSVVKSCSNCRISKRFSSWNTIQFWRSSCTDNLNYRGFLFVALSWRVGANISKSNDHLLTMNISCC